MYTTRIGAVTIGQTPRDDVVPELSRRLGADVEIIQRGVLDGIGLDVILANSPSSPEATLVSRLADGSEVSVDKDYIIPRLQEQIRDLEEQGTSLILILCTHRFEELDSKSPILRPAIALEQTVERLGTQRLGVFTPSEKQVRSQRMRWRKFASEGIRVAAASPYMEDSGIDKAAAAMRDKGVDIAIMDCIGYTEAMRARAEEVLKVPVYSAVGVLGDVAAESLASEVGGGS